jgi:molybdenum cofactor cytidylyltransferase
MKRDSAGIVGLVLAAGYSSRMVDFKPLLPLGESTVIETAVGSLLAAGIADVRVVVGWRANDLLPTLGRLDVTPVYNPDYATGMYSSVMAGVRTMGPEVRSFLLLPADNPLVKPHTVRELVRHYLESEAAVVYPCFRHRRGHPPIVSTSCLSDAPESDPPGGLRAVLSRYEESALNVEVADQGIVMDMDIPADYQAMLSYCAREGVPREKE